MELNNLFKVATNPNHLLHPFSKTGKGQEKISTGKRILGIVLFTLSFATAGILPALYLYTAHKKISKNPKMPSAYKASFVANASFDLDQAKKNDSYFSAIKKGDLNKIQKGLAGNEITVNAYSSKGVPLLNHAILHGQSEIIDLLLAQPDLEIDNVRLNTHQTALHEATLKNDSVTIKKLLEKGISPNIADSKGRAAIHDAIHNNSLEAFETLIADERVLTAKDPQEGEATPFLLAVAANKLDFIKKLIDTKKISFEDKDSFGNNLFHLVFGFTYNPVVMEEGEELLRLLIDSCPPDILDQLVNETNHKNELPLDRANQALNAYVDNLGDNATDEHEEKYKAIAKIIDELEPST